MNNCIACYTVTLTESYVEGPVMPPSSGTKLKMCRLKRGYFRMGYYAADVSKIFG